MSYVRTFRSRLTLPLLAVLVCAGAAGAEEASPSYDGDVRPVLAENCLSCHNAQKHKGDLNLEQLGSADKAMGAPEVWHDVADRLASRDMPPKRAKQHPTEEQRQLVLAWIEKHFGKGEGSCGKIATDQTQKFYHGYVMSRRLSRAEYNNSVRDLIGIDLRAGDSLPADGSGGEGFDNDGNALFLSAISVEKYLQAADGVLREVLPDEDGSASAEMESARKRILFAEPGPGLGPREAARRVIGSFARRAFRRPVRDAELDRLLSFFDRSQQRGDACRASVRLALKAVLISPNFLFLIEPQPEQDGVYRLGDYQIASRLACFLWASIPDEELLDLAEQDALHEPEVLRAQVRRMIQDPRSRGLAETFAVEWLGVGEAGGVSRPDPGRFPMFDDALAADMRREAVLFFDSIVRDDHSLLELLDADYTFANERLAKLYGIPDVAGDEFRRVKLADRVRGGVLGMAAVLTGTSYPLRTSPVLRGKWVLETLLGEKVPPPPPTAGKLPPDDRQADGLSFRQRLEQHRRLPQCASCHSRMDPLGFGLENFDPIGRWRIEQNGEPIDCSGELPNGEKFSGPRELKDIILRHRDQFLHNLSRKMLGYALGRGLNRFDDCVVEDCVKALEANDCKPSMLLEQIALSTPFQYRYAKK